MNYKKIIKTIYNISLPVIVFFIITTFIFGIQTVKSSSMKPFLKSNSIIVVDKLAYVLKEPKRRDIVVFKQDNALLVKRIIGLPNDKIKFVDGDVYINNKKYKEDYISKEIKTFCNESFIVPEGKYFVLGDNRLDSYDSRYYKNPYISKDKIKGKVFFRYVDKKAKLIKKN